MSDPYLLFEEARKQGPNPFRIETVIAAQEVWGEVISDLPDLNQHIDQKIAEAIFHVKQKYSSKIGIAIKGDRGTGKSHTIHRIWKTKQIETVFGYISPCKNPRRIDSHVRRDLCGSFDHQDIHGATQWQRLAAAAIATLQGTEFEEEYREYLEKSEQPDELRKYIWSKIGREPQKLLAFFDSLTEAILENQQNLDFDFLKAVLISLLKTAKLAQIGLAWIKGDDHPGIKDAGLPEYSEEQEEERSVWIIQQICTLAELALRPVLICFDQLDSVEPDFETGDSPAQAIARCIDRLYFKCSNVIFLCCVISDTWREIEQMGSGIPDRVSQWSVKAEPPTANQMIQLVQLRLIWFYNNKHLNSRDYPNLYPFKDSEIQKIASQGAGVRSLMDWCANQFDKMEITANIPEADEVNQFKQQKKKFRDIYNDLLEKTEVLINERQEDLLAYILIFSLKIIPDEGSENVEINRIEKINELSHDLHFIIEGYDQLNQKSVKIGVRVCETNNGKSFNAVMKRLLDYNKYNLTRGCLVRSTELPKSWKKGNELKEQLVQQQGGEVVVLKKNEIKPLVALEKIYEQAEDYGFTKDEVVNLAKQLKLVADNRLIREILSEGVTVT